MLDVFLNSGWEQSAPVWHLPLSPPFQDNDPAIATAGPLLLRSHGTGCLLTFRIDDSLLRGRRMTSAAPPKQASAQAAYYMCGSALST